MEGPASLKVIIIGGGIGGFAAAIGLRRQGHHVHVFEQSRLASEIGAAISVLPNSNSVLRQLGVNVADCGANLLQQVRYVHANGTLLQTLEVAKGAHRWQGEIRCAHRAHLHDLLKRTALSTEGDGPPADLQTSSKVLSIDPHKATVSLSDASTVSADLLVGADGAHSVTRASVSHIQPAKGAHTAFRFLITRKAAMEDPTTSKFASNLSSMDIWYGEDRKVVLYPCANNTLLNFVCIHPAELSDPGDRNEAYDTSASKEKLVETYKSFDPVVRAFLDKAEPDTIKVYPLFDMEQLPTFINDRLALIGDAAHPFLPHLAQGGSMAIEDAAALATVLSGCGATEVPARLELYNKARYQRASRIQEYTRLAGKDSLEKDQETTHNLAVTKYFEYGMSHDEIHASSQILREYEWKQRPDLRWRSPTSFGPMPSPRGSLFVTGNKDALPTATCETTSILFKTSATLLRNLFPNQSFSFKNRDTVTLASLRLQTWENVPWLGGQGYHALGLYIHDVVYTKQDGGTVEGIFLPVMFEDLADPILSGRDELGFPKLFSDINIEKKSGSMLMTSNWRGANWVQMEVHGLQSSQKTARKLGGVENLLVHRYVPGIGDPLKTAPDADYAASVQVGDDERSSQPPEDTFSMYEGASFKFDACDQHRLPTLHHIISRLAEFPIFEIVETSVEKTDGVPTFSGIQRIE